MKYICLGYHQENATFGQPAESFQAAMDECFAYDRQIQESGNWIGGEALQPTQMATSIRSQNGEVTVTDGPFAETREQLGGIMILEAQDLNHAIQIMSKHPAIKLGTTFEIRPAADLDQMIRESEQRRGVAK